MTLQDVKKQIESKNITNSFIIFNCLDNNFIANQYCKAIANTLHLNSEYLESLDIFESDSIDIFSFESESNSENLRVFKTSNFSYSNEKLKEQVNLIIITNKVDSDTRLLYNEYIVDIPKLELWQIKDYMYSILKGVDTKYIDWLIQNCNQDIFRLQSEADKITIFDENERSIIFNEMIDDNAFVDITSQNIFNFTDSLMKKNINHLAHVYEDIENIDIEAIGVVTILYQNFKKLIQVWLSKSPTPESTGLTSKQIYAINKLPRVWSQKQLIDIFEFLTTIDFNIKTGNMPMDILRDYMVVSILSK